MKKTVSLLLIVVVAASTTGCSVVRHELTDYRGEVYFTPPPGDTPPGRLRHFDVRKMQVQLFSLIMLYSSPLDTFLRDVNPEGHPVYNLTISYDNEWYDWALGAASLFTYPLLVDTFTVRVTGDVLVR